MEIRIRLNEVKEKDKVIIDFLERQYSSNEYIKSLLYNMALSSLNTVNMDNLGEVRTSMDIKNKNASKNTSQNGINTEHTGTIIKNEEDEIKDLVNDMKEFF